MRAGNNLPVLGEPEHVLAAIQRFDAAYQRFNAAQPPTNSPLYSEWDRRRAKLDQIAHGLQCIADGTRDALDVAHSVLGREQVQALLSRFAVSDNRLGWLGPAWQAARFLITGALTFFGIKTADDFIANQATTARLIEQGKISPDAINQGGPIEHMTQLFKWAVIGTGIFFIAPTVLATLGILQETTQARRSLREQNRR